MEIYIHLIFKQNSGSISINIEESEYSQICDSIGDFMLKKDKLFKLEDKVNKKCCFFKSDDVCFVSLIKTDSLFDASKLIPCKEGSEDPSKN